MLFLAHVHAFVVAKSNHASRKQFASMPGVLQAISYTGSLNYLILVPSLHFEQRCHQGWHLCIHRPFMFGLNLLLCFSSLPWTYSPEPTPLSLFCVSPLPPAHSHLRPQPVLPTTYSSYCPCSWATAPWMCCRYRPDMMSSSQGADSSSLAAGPQPQPPLVLCSVTASSRDTLIARLMQDYPSKFGCAVR